jgi:CheY-like chemotaxis protein
MTTRPLTILFVDDEPWLSESLRAVLESRGFPCVSKRDMSSAIDYIRAHEVAVIVADIMMPGGKDFAEIDSSEVGFHFVRKVRNEWPDIGIICLSVIGDQEKIVSLKKQGVLYLRKGETPLETAVKLVQGKATGTYVY